MLRSFCFVDKRISLKVMSSPGLIEIDVHADKAIKTLKGHLEHPVLIHDCIPFSSDLYHDYFILTPLTHN